jgi:hypothetical protein
MPNKIIKKRISLFSATILLLQFGVSKTVLFKDKKSNLDLILKFQFAAFAVQIFKNLGLRKPIQIF